jgi:hypothetical protein
MPISDDLLECRLGFTEIRRRAIKPTQARIGIRDHPGQRLLDFVGDGGRNRVPCHQPCLALAALGEDRVEQLRVEHRYLVQQHKQEETSGHEPEHSAGRPTDAVADRNGKEIR